MNGPSNRVAVVGSVNLDFIVECEHLPAPGETVGGGRFWSSPGGKGANQALAARRHGAEVALIAAVGNDANAQVALANLAAEGVDLSNIRAVAASHTGAAVIIVDAEGENQIAVAPGANHLLDSTGVDLASYGALLSQLEVPDSAIRQALESFGGVFGLNAAPYRGIESDILDRVDYLIVNEAEYESVSPQLAGFNGAVVVTKGSMGASVRIDGVEVEGAVPPVVEVVDTVGAGDAFCGTFMVEVVRGSDLGTALRRACVAGAEATTRQGAQGAAAG